MLWTIFAILLILWLLGWGFHVAGSLIHLLLVLAVIVLGDQPGDGTKGGLRRRQLAASDEQLATSFGRSSICLIRF